MYQGGTANLGKPSKAGLHNYVWGRNGKAGLHMYQGGMANLGKPSKAGLHIREALKGQ